MLSPETHRCLGLYEPHGQAVRCAKRETCARYVQRHHGEPAVIRQWLCPTPDEFYGAYIKQPEAA